MQGKKEDKPVEEVRKVQLTGRSTYIASLPKKWVLKMGLNAGSQLIISEHGQSLIITPRDFVKPEKLSEVTITISSKDEPDSVLRRIIALYLTGYSLIRIKTKEESIPPFQRNAVKSFVRKKLVGTEIISESEKEMVLQVLISYSELSVENALRRMCLMAMTMHENALQALKEFDKRFAQEAIILDDEVDRFSFYIIRQLKAAVQNEKALKDIGLSNPRDCLGYRVIVKFVERIADHAVKIAENVVSLNEKIDGSVFNKISEMSIFARSLFNDSINALYKNDCLLADSLISKSKTIVSMENETIKTFSKRIDVSNLRMILESIRRTAEYANDIAEIVLNLNVNRLATS